MSISMENSNYNGSMYNMLVPWFIGEIMPMTNIAHENPVFSALCAKQRELLDKLEWKHFLKKTANYYKKLVCHENQAK